VHILPLLILPSPALLSIFWIRRSQWAPSVASGRTSSSSGKAPERLIESSESEGFGTGDIQKKVKRALRESFREMWLKAPAMRARNTGGFKWTTIRALTDATGSAL
jgi:hypothetical protein